MKGALQRNILGIAALTLVSIPSASALADPSIMGVNGEPRAVDTNWTQKIFEEYPTQAIIDGLEGRVGLQVTITAEGRVSARQVVESSGHPILDKAACESFMRHARYYPARDESGKPVESQAVMRIAYSLAD